MGDHRNEWENAPPVCVRHQTAGRDSKQRPDYSHCLKVWSGHQQNKHPGSSPVKCPAAVLPPSSPPSCPRTLSASLSTPQSWPSGQRKLAVTQPGHLRLSYDHQGLTQEVLVQRNSHAETPAGIRLPQRKKPPGSFSYDCAETLNHVTFALQDQP